MRLIDADKLLERMKKGMESGSNLNGTFDLYIEHAPTVKPTGVEVVRCKDCKFYTDAGTMPNKSCCGFCTKLGAVSYYGVDATDFCSFAERREP